MSKHTISRRSFNRRLSMGLSTAALTPALACSASTMSEQPSEKLGIALVGLGSYSRGQLGPALKETQHCYLAGVVTGTPSKEKTWADEYNIPEKNIYNYENYDDIADNPDIDIIYVVLPNFMHAEYTIRAAQAGKHVICEKPMAMNVEECRQMINACNEAGVQLSMGYRLHFEPYNQEIMRLGQEEVMGKLNFIHCGAGYKMGDNWDQWRLKKELAGTGALGNMGVYAIQGAIYAVGKNPLYVRAQEFKTMPEKFKEVDETVTFQFEFPGGIVANLQTTHNARTNRLYASAEKGWFELQPFSSYGGLQGSSSQGPIEFQQVNQQARQMDAFAHCIKEGKPTSLPGEMGMRDMQIIDGILASIDQGGSKVPLENLAF